MTVLSTSSVNSTTMPMPSPPERPSTWLTAVLIAQMALGLLAMTICVPSMLDWPQALGSDAANVQLTFSAYVATYGLMQLVHGPLSDRMGRRPVLLGGLCISIVGAGVAALASDLSTLVSARALQGAGGAAGMVVGRAMVQDLFVGPQRTRMMAFVGMTMGVCPPVAMVLGGYLHITLGWQANFVLLVLVTLCLLALAWRVLPRHVVAPHSAPPPPVLGSYGVLMRNPVFLLQVLILSSSAATFYTYMAGAPLVFKHFDVPPQRLGFYIMFIPLAYIVGNVLTTRWIARLGERRLMALGQLGVFAGLGLVLLGGGWHSPLALALPLILLGVGHGLLVPPALAATVGLVPMLAGSAAALTGVLQQASGSVGGYVVALVPHEGVLHLGLMMMAWSALGALGQWWLFRRRARPECAANAPAPPA